MSTNSNTQPLVVRAQEFCVPTPVGPCLVLADGEQVLASGFTEDRTVLLGLIHPTLRPHRIDTGPPVAPIARAIAAYFDGECSAIDAIEVRQRSTALRETGWDELRRIAVGQPITYGELAKRMDMPRGARAAGQVCARNAAALFVPCHRVVSADGGLNYYAWGVAIKAWLLKFETARS